MSAAAIVAATMATGHFGRGGGEPPDDWDIWFVIGLLSLAALLLVGIAMGLS